MSDMTSAVAIDLIDNLIGMVDDNQGNDYDTALRMAIDALKTQAERTEERTETHGVCLDAIDRQAAIDAHYEYCNKHPDAGFPVWSLKILEDLPSAQPEQRWIPCSERLPDELAEVNITWINTNPAPYYEFTKGKPNTGSAVYYKGRWYWYSAVCADYLAEYGFSPDDDMDDAIKVIAWMPLPEPYREEGE